MFDYLKCLFGSGHRYGRWWWIDRPEAAHRICDDCATMQKPEQRKSWFNRARETT
jgi:hypothetical protein